MDELLEVLAEQSHIGWMQEKQRQGYADHVRSIDANGIGCCTNEKHHTDMLPYAELPEHVKDYDRVTVRGVLDGIEAAGYRVVPSDTVRKLGTAVAMLNSMVLSGEQHSDTSRTMVRAALDAPTATSAARRRD